MFLNHCEQKTLQGLTQLENGSIHDIFSKVSDFPQYFFSQK